MSEHGWKWTEQRGGVKAALKEDIRKDEIPDLMRKLGMYRCDTELAENYTRIIFYSRKDSHAGLILHGCF